MENQNYLQLAKNRINSQITAREFELRSNLKKRHEFNENLECHLGAVMAVKDIKDLRVLHTIRKALETSK